MSQQPLIWFNNKRQRWYSWQDRPKIWKDWRHTNADSRPCEDSERLVYLPASDTSLPEGVFPRIAAQIHYMPYHRELTNTEQRMMDMERKLKRSQRANADGTFDDCAIWQALAKAFYTDVQSVRDTLDHIATVLQAQEVLKEYPLTAQAYKKSA